jgi:hypothetical protein
MKQWTNISLVLGLWAIYVNATPIDQLPTNSAQDVCSMLTSLSKESQMVGYKAQKISRDCDDFTKHPFLLVDQV